MGEDVFDAPVQPRWPRSCAGRKKGCPHPRSRPHCGSLPLLPPSTAPRPPPRSCAPPSSALCSPVDITTCSPGACGLRDCSHTRARSHANTERAATDTCASDADAHIQRPQTRPKPAALRRHGASCARALHAHETQSKCAGLARPILTWPVPCSLTPAGPRCCLPRLLGLVPASALIQAQPESYALSTDLRVAWPQLVRSGAPSSRTYGVAWGQDDAEHSGAAREAARGRGGGCGGG